MSWEHDTGTNSGQKQFLCSYCDKVFHQNSDWLEHMKTHSEIEKCERCGGIVQRNHVEGHRQHCIGKITCDHCGKSFTTKSILIEHIRTHTGEKPFKCQYCDKSLVSKSALNKHVLRVHTSEKTYKCDQCNRSFATRSHLVQHTRTHTGEKPFKCDHCDKSFTQKAHLYAHIRLHTGEKPYTCERCDRSFSDKSSLVSHTKVHTGERPHKCEQCDKTFSRKTHLNRHTLVHRENKINSIETNHRHDVRDVEFVNCGETIKCEIKKEVECEEDDLETVENDADPFSSDDKADIFLESDGQDFNIDIVKHEIDES